MGLFDSFKKKVEKKSAEVNPLYGVLEGADFGINDMQIDNASGNVTISGSVDDGAVLEQINEFITNQAGVNTVSNNIQIADISDQGKKCLVVTRGSNLNVRAGASTSDAVVGRLSKDAEVLLVRRYNAKWHQVKGTGLKGEDIEGYCHTDFLKATN
jgi:hypothetical protein